MYIKKFPGILISAIGFLLAGSALGAGYTPLDLQPFKLQPRANFWGFTGDYTRGEGQMMMPIYGNQTRAFYGVLDGNIAVNDTDWLAGAGLGYRGVIKTFILGAYAFADYLHSKQNNEFWIANPGLEMLGTKWDANINGYIPFAKKKYIQMTEAFAEDLGMTGFERVTGHNVFDHRFQVLGGKTGGQAGEEASRGIDLEIGRVIPHVEQLRVYVGGYHFDSDDAGSTNGLEARLVYEFNKYVAFEAEENYDDRNYNTFVAGLRFTLGGYSAQEKAAFGISSRLMDPIEHDFVIGALSTVASTPVQKMNDLGEFLVHDNVWFFRPLTTGVSVNDIGPGTPVGFGTAESPFIGFTPENYQVVYGNRFLGKIDAFPLMYFAPGTYSFNGGPSSPIESIGFEGTNRFNLPNGWGMFGRTADYTQSANGNDRALFDQSGLDLNFTSAGGAIQTTIDSIRISNVLDSALNVTNAQNVVLRNSQFLAQDPLNFLSDSATNITNSTINFNGDNLVVGIAITNIGVRGIFSQDSILNFNTGTNTVSATGAGVTTVFGIYVAGTTLGSGVVNFINGTNTIIANGSQTAVLLCSQCIVNFNGGTNSIVGTGGLGGLGSTFGINSSGEVNFIGGTNEFNLSGLSVSGIDMNSTVINFIGGSTKFNLSASQVVQGMRIFSTTVNFTSQAEVNFNLNNAAMLAVGIDADSFCSLNGDGNPLTIPSGLNSFLNYMTFSAPFVGTLIDWEGHFTYP